MLPSPVLNLSLALSRLRLGAALKPLANPAPALVARAAAACARSGRPGLPIRWVQGAGLAIICVAGGELLLSPTAVTLLPEKELAAMVAASFAAPHFDPLRHMRHLAIQLTIVAGLLLIPFAIRLFPLLPFLSPCLLLALLLSHRHGPDGELYHLRTFEAVTAAGIDPIAYGAAFSRLFQHGYRPLPRLLQQQLLKRLAQQLEWLADISGVAPSRLQAAVTAAGIPVSLDWNRPEPPWWYPYALMVPAVLLALLVLVAGVVGQLGLSLPAMK